MMTPRKRVGAAALLLALTVAGSACGYLRDKEPWTATVQYRVGDDGGLLVEPLVINADSNHGRVQVVNDTAVRRGFSIPLLAVFEEIPPGISINVEVREAKDGETYPWGDHLNKEEGWEGRLVVVYLEEEFRDR